MNRVFEVRIEGALSDNDRDAFRQISDFTITEAPRETIIRGPIVDESQLQGLLAMVQSLSLHLVQVRELPMS
ncbi:MAG: hypothetical protein J2P19_05760 [Pseudonocardia sp.]|nr:hypothetical protein [Pseudonocardia sp.]